MPPPSPRSRARLWRLAAVLALLVALWALFQFSGLRAQLSLQTLHDGFERHRFWGFVVFTGLFVLGNLIQVPGWLFLAAAVLALGEVWGGLATYVAACVSCTTTFLAVRLLGADALRELPGRLAQTVFARLDAHPVQSVFVLRLLFQTVPALNYSLAMSGVSLRAYLIGTLTGLPLPLAIYCIFFDTLAMRLHWPLPLPH